MTTTQPGRIAGWRARRAARAARLTETGRLTLAARSILGIAGVAMAGTGARAIFVTEVEAGPTALVTIGGLLLVLAVMGRPISSIGLTDGSLAFEQIKSDLLQAESDAEVVQIVSTAVAEQPRVQNDPDIASASDRAYRNLIRDRLIGHFGNRVRSETPVGSTRADFTVTNGDKSAIIEIAFGNPNRMMDGTKLLRMLNPSFLSTDRADAIVIVSNMLEPGLHDLSEARDFAQRGSKNFVYARWTGDIDTAGFIQSVEAQLQS
ncbi:hypothetical protein [Kitasatospora sp. NPDC059327]|uniref:hypothetical protein n=1 Tax=Kitasatospora sp. NPDC059327 TaxID=3346803 RepID=UPI0036AB50CB